MYSRLRVTYKHKKCLIEICAVTYIRRYVCSIRTYVYPYAIFYLSYAILECLMLSKSIYTIILLVCTCFTCKMKKIFKLLKKIYYDENSPAGYSSKNKLFKKAKEINKNIKFKHIETFFQREKIPSRFSKGKKKYTRSIFVERKFNRTWVTDLADMNILSRFNKQYKWFCVLQDLFSQKIITIFALKSKKSEEVAENFKKIFEKNKPEKILSDKGGEFSGKCLSVYKQFNIKHVQTKDVTQKAATVERLISVIKTRLYRIMNVEKNWVWINKLDSVIESYNNSFHRILKMSPNKAANFENQSVVFHNTVNAVENSRLNKKIPKFKYKLGQIVRILKDQSVFAKGFTGNYSNMLYQIYKREMKPGAVPMYLIRELLSKEEVDGAFYTEELKPVKIDFTKLPVIEKIYSIRQNNEQEEVLVKFNNENYKKWINYDDLIPYF